MASPRKVERVGKKPGTFAAGHDPRRGTSGGRPKAIVEIERMLDAEHRNVANLKEVFAQLKAMATENVISRWVDKEGNEHETIRQPNPQFMAMYLERILGPVKPLELDLTDAPPEALAWLAKYEN